MKNRTNTKIKKCIICEREYHVYLKSKSHHSIRIIPVRRHNSITCSSKCSKIHQRIEGEVLNKFYERRWRLKK